ncbi:hypothetical protein FX988_01417 [Paraglaciecola mesophila]|uniref:Uncharacterized protein n=1 Tax=Paraglaciecola mesophila TaxID=197222 RepID=A0A857JGN1_9ALTE|nr:hypothetical protein FX988_01417 [Paraglaciecola mesophila]
MFAKKSTGALVVECNTDSTHQPLAQLRVMHRVNSQILIIGGVFNWAVDPEYQKLTLNTDATSRCNTNSTK